MVQAVKKMLVDKRNRRTKLVDTIMASHAGAIAIYECLLVCSGRNVVEGMGVWRLAPRRHRSPTVQQLCLCESRYE